MEEIKESTFNLGENRIKVIVEVQPKSVKSTGPKFENIVHYPDGSKMQTAVQSQTTKLELTLSCGDHMVNTLGTLLETVILAYSQRKFELEMIYPDLFTQHVA